MFEQIEFKPEDFRRVPKIPLSKAKRAESHEIEIEGIKVDFPYIPYPQQVEIMTSTIKAFSSNNIAAIESPTGTGKTLSLLCASLAFLYKQRQIGCEEQRKIIYTTRTNLQLDNIARELRKTIYRPNYTILASRDSLCINSTLSDLKGATKNTKCITLLGKKKCPYHSKEKSSTIRFTEVMDIEEINIMGAENKICPYYNSKALIQDADLVIMTYNYLLDDAVRASCKIDLEECYVIFDEGHNICQSLESSSSITLNATQLESCLVDLRDYKGLSLQIQDEQDFRSDDNLRRYKQECTLASSCVSRLVQAIKETNIGQYDKYNKPAKQLTPEEFFSLLFHSKKQFNIRNELIYADISPDSCLSHISTMEEIIKKLSEKDRDTQLKSYVRLLRTALSLYTAAQLHPDSTDLSLNLVLNYFILIYQDDEDVLNLGAFNMNPGMKFKQLFNETVKGMVITSGTLSPIEALEKELSIKFGSVQSNSHVVKTMQRNFDIIQSFNDVPLDFAYSNRNNRDLLFALGECIIELIGNTPGNVLLYFGSASYLKQVFDFWKRNGILDKMMDLKDIYSENKDKDKNKEIMEHFLRNGGNSKGAVLLTVMRSSASEGFNFTDDMARMAVVVGVPFANFTGLRLILKRKFLSYYGKICDLNWNTWYAQNAMAAVNQSLGRVIRHLNDYGSMICIDKRFDSMLKKGYFCDWFLNNSMKRENWVMKYNPVVKNKNFFEIIKNTLADAEEKEEPEEKFSYSFSAENEKKKEICSICQAKDIKPGWCKCELCGDCRAKNASVNRCVKCMKMHETFDSAYLFY